VGVEEVPTTETISLLNHYISAVNGGMYRNAVEVAEQIDPHGCGMCEEVKTSLGAQAVSLATFTVVHEEQRVEAATEAAAWYRDLLRDVADE